MHRFITLSNGFKIPAIGFGCGAVKPEDVEGVIQTALDAGYRLFDCALLYGNEPFIGDAFANIFSKNKYSREDIFITTKLPMIGNHPERVETFVKKSLSNLKMSYIDLYLIHFPVGFHYNNDEDYFPKKDGIIQLDFSYSDLCAVWRAMEDQVKAGRTKSIGVSNFNVAQIQKLLQIAKIPPANLQTEVHAYFQQKELRAYCKQNEIVVSAYAPLGSPGRRELFKPNGIPDVLTNPIVVKIAKKYRKTTAQILLRFLVEDDVIPLPKSSTADRIHENIDIFDFELTHKELEQLNFLDQGEKGRSFDYLKIFAGLDSHPENPMTENRQASWIEN